MPTSETPSEWRFTGGPMMLAGVTSYMCMSAMKTYRLVIFATATIRPFNISKPPPSRTSNPSSATVTACCQL